MRNWFLLSVVCVFAFIGGRASLAQGVTSQNPRTNADQRDPHRVCPTVSVSCPGNPDFSHPFDFTATVAGGDPDVTPTYTWEVANGEIVTGQETPAIRVRPVVANQTVTATVRIGGYDSVCSRTASCSTVVCRDNLPTPRRVDTYGLISSDQVRVKLEQFADALTKQPGALGYIRVLGRQENTDKAHKAEDAKQYLVEKFDIEKNRIRIDHGGIQEEFMVELWLIPQGSYLPEVPPKKVPSKN